MTDTVSAPPEQQPEERPAGSTLGIGVVSAPSSAPRPLPPLPPSALPHDRLGYRFKNFVLGPPLHTEQLEHERLGKPTALAVFASDNLSSSAYASEEILRTLVPIVGVGAFALVVPITVALLIVLGFLILSYRQTIKAYPSAGGAYIVTRDNFGVLPAQVAGVALLTDYVLTVSVSVAAGTAALASAFSALTPYVVPISVAFIIFIAYGNLRGVKESGKMFAVPTYFFIFDMALLLGVGLFKMAFGHLPRAQQGVEGMLAFGTKGSGLLAGASVLLVLRAFASGGAAVTGVEAISNGVPAFRKPEWRNARSTLVVMGSLLGAMFLGLSILASHMRVAPFKEGTPTVISQVGELVYGKSALGHILYYGLQAGTMLILVLAANTSFADFPRLASFHAGDKFMPRQLTKRGHRLVYSNGIIFLAVASIFLVIVTEAKVDRLIPLYAIGVFTSFTLSQAGMARHHITHKEQGWRGGLFINGMGAVLSGVVDIIIAIAKFTHGAWVIVVLVPIMVMFLVRLAHQYEREDEALEHDVPAAVKAKIKRRLTVLVFIDRLDLAAARAIQVGRSFNPDSLRAVHFVIDQHHAAELRSQWEAHGLSNVALELIDCPDRRLNRSAVTAVAHVLAEGDTEVTVLLPDRKYRGLWRRLLHDQTAESLARDISRMPHASVTTVPFHFNDDRAEPIIMLDTVAAPSANGGANGDSEWSVPLRPVSTLRATVGTNGVVPIAEVQHRQRATVVGVVQAVRVQPLAGTATLEIVIGDGTGALSIVFLGRRRLAGVDNGAHIKATGMVADHFGRLAMLNPSWELLSR